MQTMQFVLSNVVIQKKSNEQNAKFTFVSVIHLYSEFKETSTQIKSTFKMLIVNALAEMLFDFPAKPNTN